ncbi:predicted protein [Streptomyces viridosporus ATCC 14672]|uniref:Predicted protein n=1 Tax=Streptomyces viridosporus (strain ATCC 14672 / DSM 40746 / JCM 4963 / KCTC 9882 / NRRL B-12104 / FH 1290) TaxID=566461 RepID=D6A658_STRV1|nr:predicted protein [Streptomyces viridosporus ATCC 14672]
MYRPCEWLDERIRRDRRVGPAVPARATAAAVVPGARCGARDTASAAPRRQGCAR